MISKFVLFAACALPALPAVIDFDGLSDGDVVTNQFAGVVFSSTPGANNQVTEQPTYNGTGVGDQ